MKILVTGGAGFIGSHFVKHVADNDLMVVDGLNYAGNMKRIAPLIESGQVKKVYHDIRADFEPVYPLIKQFGPEYIVHFAAETHVDRSISNPRDFVQTNVVGTFNVLELAKRLGVKKYIQISTDEVYGPAYDNYAYTENDRVLPSNPYAATKVGGDALALAYANTYGMPITITRTMNNFGETQHPEKFIPSIMRNLLNGDKITIHGSEDFIGSRFWLHARNNADAIYHVLRLKESPSIVNIAGEREIDNLELFKMIARYMGISYRGKYVFKPFTEARPGHDARYAIDGTYLRKVLKWKQPMNLESSLQQTVEWTMDNREWLLV